MKRILSLDGGGMRGVFTLQILKRIEKIFKDARGGGEDFVLRDAFDFFAGTSTGAIIATFLAWGKSVEQIESLYIANANDMFAHAPLLQRLSAKFLEDRIAKFFQKEFREEGSGGEALLGTRKLYAGPEAAVPKYLLITVRDATTGSSWQVINNPEDEHARRQYPGAPSNLDIPLWKLLRASTAAPTFFKAQEIEIGGEKRLFIDGGITPYNNPSLLAAMMATMPRHNIQWPTGPHNIHLVSIGTGHGRVCLSKQDPAKVNVIDNLKYVVPALMHTVAKEQDKICRLLAHCLNGRESDDGTVDVNERTRLFDAGEKKFSYVRYNHEFTPAEHEEAQEIVARSHKLPGRLLRMILKDDSNAALLMDRVCLTEFFQRTGREYAERAVQPEHLLPGIL